LGLPEPETYPMSGIFFGCCASAREAVIAKTIVSSQKRILLLIRFSPVVLPADYW